MAKYSEKTIEAAIEVLLCTADVNFDRMRRGMVSMTTHDIALDSWLHTGNKSGPIANLADAAWFAAIITMDRIALVTEHAVICLEAAQLLREGWLPGDEAIEL